MVLFHEDTQNFSGLFCLMKSSNIECSAHKQYNADFYTLGKLPCTMYMGVRVQIVKNKKLKIKHEKVNEQH